MRAIVIACCVAFSVAMACGGDISSNGDDANGSGSGKVYMDAPADLAPLAFCVSETNRYRAMNSKPALAENAALEAYAAVGAMDDFNTSPHHHFSTTQGGGIAQAENECPQQGNWQLPPGGDMKALVGQCVAAFYSEGPGSDYNTHGHYINMMGPYSKLGCGIYQSGSKVTIVQDYGP